MNASGREFYTDFVRNISGDQRELFAATNKLLNQTADTPFPPHCDKLALANDMGRSLLRKYLIFALALMQLRICEALLTAFQERIKGTEKAFPIHTLFHK